MEGSGGKESGEMERNSPPNHTGNADETVLENVVREVGEGVFEVGEGDPDLETGCAVLNLAFIAGAACEHGTDGEDVVLKLLDLARGGIGGKVLPESAAMELVERGLVGGVNIDVNDTVGSSTGARIGTESGEGKEMTADVGLVIGTLEEAGDVAGTGGGESVCEKAIVGISPPLDDVAWTGDLDGDVDVPPGEVLLLLLPVNQGAELVESVCACVDVADWEGIHALGSTELDHEVGGFEAGVVLELVDESGGKGVQLIALDVDAAKVKLTAFISTSFDGGGVGGRPMSPSFG